MHEHPGTTWLWDLSFVEELRDKDDVQETTGNACRFQMTDKIAEDNAVKESGFISNSECIIERLRERSQDSSRTRFVLSVLKGLKNEIHSAKVLGLMEIGITCEETNVLEVDEYTWSCCMRSTPSVERVSILNC